MHVATLIATGQIGSTATPTMLVGAPFLRPGVLIRF